MANRKPDPASDPGAPAPSAPAAQTIEELKARYDKLHRAQIEADTNLRNAQDRLEELKKEAREKFDTDDVAELERKLHQMHKENEEKRAKYQADLDQIERDLQTVEEEFAAEERGVNGPREKM